MRQRRLYPRNKNTYSYQRGLDFNRAAEVFAEHHFTLVDAREDYVESRYITVGMLDGRMIVMVWTPRGEVRRIISMRKANDREQARYARHFSRSG
ncbi:BrnT family toxin [Burkholderia perseverans]|uniref:BrnT family toxin n=1 Tax=Burkholderia perseverans TaxID=2615214 RepID=UPI001FEFFAEE|nr:BrnT family toxin [Burkholderia perseverans]